MDMLLCMSLTHASHPLQMFLMIGTEDVGGEADRQLSALLMELSNLRDGGCDVWTMHCFLYICRCSSGVSNWCLRVDINTYVCVYLSAGVRKTALLKVQMDTIKMFNMHMSSGPSMCMDVLRDSDDEDEVPEVW